jgi:hypothetical protein
MVSPFQANYEFLHLPVSNVHVETLTFDARVLHRGSSQAPFRHIFVFLTGNPGLVSFYEKFLLHVQQQRPSMGVLAVGLTGHSSINKNGSRVFSLDDQVHHKLEIFDMLMQLHPGVRFYLAGHSVGSFISKEILRLAGDRIPFERVFLLFPTIRDIGKQGGGVHYLIAPGVRHAVAGFAGLLSWTPAPVKSALVRAFGPSVADCPGVIEKLISYSTLANVFHLTRTEFEQIRDLDVATLERHLEKLVFYYGTTDGWVPMEHYHDVKSRFPGHPHVYLDKHGSKHAFCLGHSHLIAGEVLLHVHDEPQSVTLVHPPTRISPTGR